MNDKEKIEAYFNKEQPFKEGILMLREIVKSTELKEALKWGVPIYTVNNKNVVGVLAFKNHFGLWFYNGSLLKDVINVLENAQEGKTKFMRHWKFTAINEINKVQILSYLNEAIEIQKNNKIPKVAKIEKVIIPEILIKALDKNKESKKKFDLLTPYKQKEYYEFISSAKQEKTKESRLKKSLDLISEGKGLNDMYRK